jgi:hypothetical protein
MQKKCFKSGIKKIKASHCLMLILLTFAGSALEAAKIKNKLGKKVFISSGLDKMYTNEIAIESGASFDIPENWGNKWHSFVYLRPEAGPPLKGEMLNKYGVFKFSSDLNYVILNKLDNQVFLEDSNSTDTGDDNNNTGDGGNNDNDNTNPDTGDGNNNTGDGGNGDNQNTSPADNGLLKNGQFEQDLASWLDFGNCTIVENEASGKAVCLSPTETVTSRAEQIVSGLEVGKKYILSAKVDSNASWAYIGVSGIGEKGTNKSGTLTYEFTATAEDATVYLQTWKQQTGNAIFDDITLIPAENASSGGNTGSNTGENSSNTGDDNNNGSGDNNSSSGEMVFANGDFEDGLTGWTTINGKDKIAIASDGAYSGDKYLSMQTGDERVKITQEITGLKPKTKYTCAVRVKLKRDNLDDPKNAMTASFEIKGDTQRDVANNSRMNKQVSERLDWISEDAEGQWIEKRAIFYTAEDGDSVTISLEADKGVAGEIAFDSIRIVEGDMPLPPEAATTNKVRPKLPIVKAPGENMVANSDFSEGLNKWITSGQVDASGENNVKLIPGELTAKAIQEIPVYLAPNTTYTLSTDVNTGGIDADIMFQSKEFEWLKQVNNTSWENEKLTFTTPDKYIQGKIILQSYKGQTGDAEFKNVELKAVGGEWLPSPDGANPRKTTEVLFDDFENDTLDPNKWLVVKKGWGGENNGVIPENVSIENGILKLRGYGDLHDGLKRAGAAIATRDYYASGSYEVRARLAPDLGACSAFWSFHYDEKFPNEREYWEEGNPKRNTEIDWEFPTAMSDGRTDDPISQNNLRANSWGGTLGGEGAHHPGRVETDTNMSNDWHTYRYDWHSTGTPDDPTPRIEFFIDDKKVYEIKGASWGQDNIGEIASRFWLGLWFPAAGWAPTGDVGWAGSPNFDTTCLEIDWVKITPFNEANDKWEPELLPNDFYVPPHEYPGYGSEDFPKVNN